MASINPRKRKAYVTFRRCGIVLTDGFHSVDFSEPTVTVLVGTTKQIFNLHPSILVSSSKFFRSALSGPWKESKNRSITLPETKAGTFQLYAAYVYTGEIDICAEPLNYDADLEARFLQLAELYTLGDVVLDDKALRNAVIDAILDLEDRTCCEPDLDIIKHAYDNSSGKTTLCHLLLDNALACTPPGWLKGLWCKLPEAFVQALACGWAQQSCNKEIIHRSSMDRPRCDYHEHDDEVPADGPCGANTAASKPYSKKQKK